MLRATPRAFAASDLLPPAEANACTNSSRSALKRSRRQGVQCATVALLTPLRHMGGVQAVPAKQFAAGDDDLGMECGIPAVETRFA